MDERGGSSALGALVLLEWRRVLPTFLRSLAMAAVVTGAVAAAGAFTLPRLAFILSVVGAVPVMGFPMNALRDKLDGGLEFLSILPVSPADQAAGRLVALAAVAVPGAVVATLAAVLALQDTFPGVLAVRPVLQIFGAALSFIVGSAFLATAMVLRFDVHRSNYLALAILGAAWVLDRAIPDPVGTFLALSAQPWFMPATGAVGLVGVVAAAWAAFSLACSGIERFTPSGDRLTW